MPVDLLRYLIEPTSPSYALGWVAVALVLLTALWFGAVFWWTAADRKHTEPSVIGSARVVLQRRRALRAIATIRNRHRAGDLTDADAGSALGEELRRFLRDVTGIRAEYVQVPDIPALPGGVLAPAAPVLADLEDAQFNAESTVDVDATGQAAEDLVRRWT